ncbi:MAG TPA: class I SAM-dependent methyltransferase [Thermoplasmata archaeon]|nr:class I SAM-dependent methyltransferase [Thermoplasmata archaeon]
MHRATATGHRSPPRAVGQDGWRRASVHYRPGTHNSDPLEVDFDDHEDWLRPVFRLLERGSEVLDLGCGCGIPDSQILSNRFRVTGVDISDVQIERARRLVPKARFLRADMATVRFPPETFSGIVCLYSLIHVPPEERRPLIARMYRWLYPGGVVLVTTGDEVPPSSVDDRLGSNAKLYRSHADSATYGRWLSEAGFEVLRRTSIDTGEPGRALFLAQKPPGAPILRHAPRTSRT